MSSGNAGGARGAAAGCLRSLLTVVVVLVVAFGAWKVFGDDDDKSPSAGSGTKSGSWEVGDCGGPDPEASSDSYNAYDCDDSKATFKALKIMSAGILPDSIQCPAGTDLIIKVSVTYGSSKSGGIPTSTVCGRNLSGDHPGDAGAGGGQLVTGDCITDQAKEIACSGAGGSDYKVLGLVKEESECPKGTTDPLRLTMAIGRPYDVICGGKAV
ncbi:hypothetical protein [Streptomyces sp. NBC_01217]|uniref:hypothetical protein n=1 Tax=Streptomyces sp. NBC_01217 TaxID=2903779 RepID=UPI002E14D8CA|nr:hypothetical protein OG507_11110 [Streptomyces sp. NBC_01217]